MDHTGGFFVSVYEYENEIRHILRRSRRRRDGLPTETELARIEQLKTWIREKRESRIPDAEGQNRSPESDTKREVHLFETSKGKDS